MGVVHDAVDGRGGGHGVATDRIPLGEHDVTGDHDATPLVAFGEQFEQDFRFAVVLLHVADVVEALALEAVKALEFALQTEVALGVEQTFRRWSGRG